MFILIPLPSPTGSDSSVTLGGVFWKLVSCENCQGKYAYQLEVMSSGAGYSRENDNRAAQDRAFATAESNLDRMAQSSHAAVPCPQCGWYQEYMLPLVRRQKIHWLQIVGGVLAALALAALPMDETKAFAGVGILAGMILIFAGFFLRLRRNPNAGDPRRRLHFARNHALWGDRLEKLLKEQPMHLS